MSEEGEISGDLLYQKESPASLNLVTSQNRVPVKLFPAQPRLGDVDVSSSFDIFQSIEDTTLVPNDLRYFVKVNNATQRT